VQKSKAHLGKISQHASTKCWLRTTTCCGNSCELKPIQTKNFNNSRGILVILSLARAKFQALRRENYLNSRAKYISSIKTDDLIVEFSTRNQNDLSITERGAAPTDVEGGGGLLVAVDWE
jgi:hypothetical protein